MKKQILGLCALAVTLASCGGGSSSNGEQTQEKKVQLAEEVCSYNYAGVTTVNWTAFKFTSKTGVGGTLDSFAVRSAQETYDSPHAILENLEFDIYTGSVNSKNEDRDKKIMEHFFGSMIDGEMIQGKVTGIKGDETGGTATVALTFNGKMYTQEMEYMLDGLNMSLRGEIDLINWEAGGAVDALNKVCEDLHKGEDGVSKLWPNVEIEVKTILGQNCK